MTLRVRINKVEPDFAGLKPGLSNSNRRVATIFREARRNRGRNHCMANHQRDFDRMRTSGAADKASSGVCGRCDKKHKRRRCNELVHQLIVGFAS